MEFRPYTPSDVSVIEQLFISVFSQAESEAEGQLIGHLARDLMTNTERQDWDGFVAVDGTRIVGAIIFSRLTFESPVDAFILAPVAVQTEYQGRGIGQALIKYGLQEMQRRGVSLVVTYGDPAFYAKVGFQPVSLDRVPSPLELSQPEGWLAQSLTDRAVEAIPGGCACVPALNNPAYW